MKALDALGIINSISSQQWGMVTSAQATMQGINRTTLSRLERYGHLERLRQGVYRVSAAPATRLEAIYAAWLSLEPGIPSYLRSKEPDSDAMVSGVTAAYVLDIGELNPEPITFTVPRRRQLRDKGIRTLSRHLEKSETTIVQGLPVTTMERTIVDLVADGIDQSLVLNAVSDALKTGRLDTSTLAEYLKPFAKRARYESGGIELLIDRLTGTGGMDV